MNWDLSSTLSEGFVSAKVTFAGPFFMDIFACTVGNIWKVRNGFIFKDIPISFYKWEIGFQSDLLLHKYRLKAANVQPLVEWIISIF
jgi:hypothetical protein